jgi:abequosyltransferase
MPKLSICIPTYNRAEYLRSTVASVAGQLTSDVEVIISDNASADGTSEVIAGFQKTHRNIKYFRSEINLGPDRNYLRAVSLATGEYCWLFGSDDIFSSGAVATVLALLSSGSTICLFDRTECDSSMRPLARQREWLQSKPKVFDFSVEDNIHEYLNLATSLGAAFSYLSSIIVKRSAWNSVHYDERFTGTAYSHAFILLLLVSRGCTLTYTKERLVSCRLGNDYFANDGPIKRRLLDIDGYSLLADVIFKDKPLLRRALLDLLLRQHPWTSFSLCANPQDERWRELRSKVLALGTNPYKLKVAEWMARVPLLRDLLLPCMEVVKNSYADLLTLASHLFRRHVTARRIANSTEC